MRFLALCGVLVVKLTARLVIVVFALLTLGLLTRARS